jgi:Ca2+-binding RTX toxin-like protein
MTDKTPPSGGIESNIAAENNGGVADFESFGGKLLTTFCTISTTTPPTLTIAVPDGETVYVARTPEGRIAINALTGMGGATCEVPATGLVRINPSGTAVAAGRTAIIDYANGLFATASSLTVPGIIVDFQVTGMGAQSTNDTIKIRGRAENDTFNFGTGTTAGFNAFNANGDTFPDVTMRHVETIIVNGGDGNDVITGNAGLGTGTVAFPGVLRIYGGAGNDTLTGGLGNDILVGGAGDDKFFGSAGQDTVDYSARTGNLTIQTVADPNAGAAASSGEASEADKVADAIPVIRAGAGNDTITILATSTVSHTVYGGAGHDSFTGSAAAGAGIDKFIGEAGEDSCTGNNTYMDYSGRSVAVTVTVCNPGLATCAETSANDGNQTAVEHRAGDTWTSPIVLDTGTVYVVAGLSGMRHSDVGRRLKMGGFTAGANDDMVDGYVITEYISPTSVKINVSSNSGFVAGSLGGSGTAADRVWEVWGHEGDNVACAGVFGSSVGDTLTGDNRANTIYGGGGDDTIVGGAGDDKLYGEAGDDTIYGGAGNDTIHGGAGEDTMYGGDHDDVLNGGPNQDTFWCDGNNAPLVSGTSAGEADFTVSYNAMEDAALGMGHGCEF